MKRILVTGGAGFVGSNLCRRLLDDGCEVICLDNFYTSQRQNITQLINRPNFQLIEHDIIEPYDITDIDEIYNLACPASPPHYQRDPIYTTKVNVLGSLNILDIAYKTNARILQASTSEVYGDALENPQTEKYWGNVNPNGIRSCYDEGKRSAESLFFDYHRQSLADIRVIRIFNTYGPGMSLDDGRVVSNFIVQALTNHNITIYGDGLQTRSFQYIEDLVEGMLSMMSHGFIGPLNIGNPQEFTIKELAEMILEIIPESTSKIEYKDLPDDDPRKRNPDISLAKDKLGWQPNVELRDGLRKTVEYFREITKAP